LKSPTVSGTFPNTRQFTILGEKLIGFDAGAYPADVRELTAGLGWLAGARSLAREIEAVQTGAHDGPVLLVDRYARAVYQVLRLTHFDAADTRGLAGLSEALREQLGYAY
jgi:hypothetical protein